MHDSRITKEPAIKKRYIKIAVIIICVVLAAAFLVLAVLLKQSDIIADDGDFLIETEINDKLDKAVSDVILSNNGDKYLSGEFRTESHFVFDSKEKGETVTVYLIEDYAEFYFYNGFFTVMSGGRTPAVFTFNKNGDDYKLVKSEYAQDGSLYADSVKKMFHGKNAEKVIKGLSDEANEIMWTDKVLKARKYLEAIGRESAVVSYDKIQTVSFEDCGIATDVVNKICDMGLEYDCTISNHEKTENGKRYVYQTDYDKQNNRITFTKFEYNTNNIVEFIALDGATGNVIKNAPKPETVKYNKGRIVATGN